MSGRAGRTSGNALGALGLFFSSFESGLGYVSDGRTPDAVNSVGAGTVKCCILYMNMHCSVQEAVELYLLYKNDEPKLLYYPNFMLCMQVLQPGRYSDLHVVCDLLLWQAV